MATSDFVPRPVPEQVSLEVQQYLDDMLNQISVLLNQTIPLIDDATIAHTDADETITGAWDFSGNATFDGTATFNGAATLFAPVTLQNGSNTLQFTGSGSIADITASGFTRLDFEGLSVIDIQGSNLRIRNTSEGADYATFSHDGTDFSIALTSSANMEFSGPSGGYLFDDGTWLSFQPTGDSLAQNPSLTYTAPDHAISLATSTSGDSLAFTLYNQDGSNNPRAAFFMDDTLSEYGLAQTWSSGAQLRFVIASAGSAEFVGDWGGNLAYFRNGNKFRVYDSGNTDYVELYHNGTDAYFNGVNANWLRIGNLGSGILTLNGAEQRWYDSDNSDSIKLVHNGSHGHLMLGNKGGDDNGIVIYPETGGPNRSGFFVATRGFGNEATGTYALPNSRDGGFVWIVASSTSSAEGVEGAHFYFSGTTMVDLGSGTNFSLGSGSNPNTAGKSNVWRSSAGVLSIKNRRGAFRYYSIYCMFGD